MRENTLYLSAAGAASYEPLAPLYAWFTQNLLPADSHNRALRLAFTAQLTADQERRRQAVSLLQMADLGITDLVDAPDLDADMVRNRMALAGQWTNSVDPDEAVEMITGDDFGLRLTHGTSLPDTWSELDLSQESVGTVVWLGLIGPVLDALQRGTSLLVDEVDASLHPILVAELVRLFQDPAVNMRGAQLIFNSHDSNLLSDAVTARVLGRDQIWFTDKDRDTGAARLYQLLDFDPRKQESIGKRYLDGRYGAVPIVSPAHLHAVREA